MIYGIKKKERKAWKLANVVHDVLLVELNLLRKHKVQKPI